VPQPAAELRMSRPSGWWRAGAVIGTALDTWMLYPGWERGKDNAGGSWCQPRGDGGPHRAAFANSPKTRHEAIGTATETAAFGREKATMDLDQHRRPATDARLLAAAQATTRWPSRANSLRQLGEIFREAWVGPSCPAGTSVMARKPWWFFFRETFGLLHRRPTPGRATGQREKALASGVISPQPMQSLRPGHFVLLMWCGYSPGVAAHSRISVVADREICKRVTARPDATARPARPL